VNRPSVIATWILLFLVRPDFSATPNPPDGRKLEPVSGVVEDTNGKPINGVWVLNLRLWGGRVDTASDGSFRIEESSGRLLFNHPSYAPEFVLLRPGQRLPIRITLRTRASVEWKLAKCKGVSLGDPTHHRRLKLKIPRGFDVLKSRDVDYNVSTVVERRSKAVLDFWQIASYSAGMPEFKWYDGLVELRTRPIDLAGWEGFDVRGTTTDGRVSRWMGTLYTNVVYSTVSADVARKFDRIIDSACYY